MAKCSNCNAPLANGMLQCAYCGSRNDVDLKGINYYTTHENDAPRICPRCDIRLKTIDLKLNGTFLIERCDRCYGLFFDPGELEALLEATVNNVFLIDRTGLESINQNRAAEQYPISYIKCPVCSQRMNRVNFGAQSGVIVDRCKAHGVWLDGGELHHLCEWMKMGGKLLDQKRREEQQKSEQQQEMTHRRELAGYGTAAPAFGSFGEPLRQADPDLFDIIYKAIRFFAG